MKKQALTAFFLAVLTVGMVSVATAASVDDTENSDVTVNVTQETALDVKPDTLTYNQVSVGDRVNVTDNDHGYETLKVENTGSEEIREVWAGVDLPATNPFGSADSGSASDHVSSNFLQIRPEDDGAALRGDHQTYSYVERVEFFQDDYPLVEVDGSEFGSSGYNNMSVGRIRTGNNEFYFALGYDASDCSTAELRVADTPTTPDTLGTTDFRDSNSGDWTNYSVSSYSSGTDGYGITGDSVNLALTSSVSDLDQDETQTYDILTKCDALPSTGDGIEQPHILLSKYNIEAGDADDLYAGDGTTTTQIFREGGDYLSPGENFGVDVAVQVPRGVPAGDIATGTLTIYSQASTN